jgi:hypothetical protein
MNELSFERRTGKGPDGDQLSRRSALAMNGSAS